MPKTTVDITRERTNAAGTPIARRMTAWPNRGAVYGDTGWGEVPDFRADGAEFGGPDNHPQLDGGAEKHQPLGTLGTLGTYGTLVFMGVSSRFPHSSQAP